MQILGPGRIQWEFFVTLHPLFEQALPPRQLPPELRTNPRVQNDIAMIRQTIRALPLVFPNIDLDRDFEESKYNSFSNALLSVLEVFETLVQEDVRETDTAELDVADPQGELELRHKYPRLAVLQSRIRHSVSSAPSTIRPDQPKSSNKHPSKTMEELTACIDYIGLGKSRKYDSRQVATAISNFKSMIDNIFADPLEAVESNLGNTELLNNDDISFIRRASRLNSLSLSLFTMLVKSIACCKAHKARLHLSGFLDSNVNFELLITDCEKEHWKFANCRLVSHQQPGEFSRTRRGCCTHSQLVSATSVHLAFDSEDIWDDEVRESLTAHDIDSDSPPTLLDLLLPKRDNGADEYSDSEIDVQEFLEEDQKIVELLVASSLLNLNASAWLRADFNIKNILLLAAPAVNRRWKPHVECYLTLTDSQDEVHDAILSFGILLMEIEAKKLVRPKTVDRNWETGLPSKDTMLKRTIEEWNRAVGDRYRHVAMACLRFRELSARFYDPHPGLTQEMKNIAAIYKYILAPLYRVITTQYSKISTMFSSFLNSLHGSLTTRPHQLTHPVSSLALHLFDGSETHNPKDIKTAANFMMDTQGFRNMIEQLSNNATIPPWASQCRTERIRIAIIDTGIDDEDDNLIEGSRESGRIKDRCGFINDSSAKPDYSDYRDHNGHGTHVARLILEMAPAAELFIAKVSNNTSIQPTDLHRITRAINWAHKDMHVNIISMSFGLEITRDKEIDRAIHAAYKANITMFAAASNSGGNKSRAYPSNRGSGVICIHASDGLGNDGGISLTPIADTDNFSTLGISISSKWKGNDVLKSGTSFATPIAAALAADVLEFARHKCDLENEEMERLCEYESICKILRLMASKRQGYSYVMPLYLWNGKNKDEDIVKEIYEIAGR